MASGVLLLSSRAQPIIARDYRGEVKLQDVPARFYELIVDENAVDPAPVVSDNGITYCWVRQNDIYAVAVSRLHVNALTTLVFLRRLCELLTQHLHRVDQETIRDNFVMVYEILDEVIDNGYPQITEPKVLKKLLSSSRDTRVIMNPALNSPVSWRAEGIKHKKNEVFLDVIEKVDCLVSASNRIIRSETVGSLKMKCCLSGMPELKLGLNDKASATELGPGSVAVDLQNIRFHQCVRLNKFEADRTISFVPPDGEFELMSYTVPNEAAAAAVDETALPFWLEVTLGPHSLEAEAKRIEYFVKLKSSFKPRKLATRVEVIVPAPREASNPQFKCSSGVVKYRPEQAAIVWTLKHMPGQKEQIMSASVSRPSTAGGAHPDLWYRRPAEVAFEIPFFTTSKINVRYLRIFEASGYQALPWVRYITQNGNYQFRLA